MARKDHRERDERAKDGVGPASIEGVEASDLPDKGKGSVETDFGKEAGRHLPEATGGTIGGDSGMHGDAGMRDADREGGRKKN
jgi:hypothetical protein